MDRAPRKVVAQRVDAQIPSVDPLLDQAALDAVAGLEFVPASYAGEPVEVVLSVAIELGPPLPPEPTVISVSW